MDKNSLEAQRRKTVLVKILIVILGFIALIAVLSTVGMFASLVTIVIVCIIFFKYSKSAARNNPTTHTNTAYMHTLWYYEDGMESPYLSYDKMQAKYLYLLSARDFANERFLTLEKTGVISKWANKEVINIAKTNQTWLSKSYLEEMSLIFGHKNI